MHRCTVFHDDTALIHSNIRSYLFSWSRRGTHREMTTHRGICLI